jgi:L-ascorbate metabolism protein UlaG (beta-lactamase superfamily)
LEVANIVARDDLSPQGLRNKVNFVLNEMQEILYFLIDTHIELTEINVYTIHDILQLNDQIHKYFPGLANS